MLATTGGPDYLRMGEAAALVRVNPRTLRRWVREGLPTVSRGSGCARLVRRQDILDFVAGRIPRTRLT